MAKGNGNMLGGLVQAVHEMQVDQKTMVGHLEELTRIAKNQSHRLGRVEKLLAKITDRLLDHEERISALEAADR